MENYPHKIISPKGGVPLKIIPGHFATSHSHVNYYLDSTTLKSRQSEAGSAARALVPHYIANTIVDSILCLDSTQVIGAYLAQELSRSGFLSINAHQTIYIVTPEYDPNGQMIFRDNIQPMIQGKHVLVLAAAITTGITARKGVDCIRYYGGAVMGICAVFSAIEQAGDVPVHAIFTKEDIPQYQSYPSQECPLCQAGQKLDGLINGYGYSGL